MLDGKCLFQRDLGSFTSRDFNPGPKNMSGKEKGGIKILRNTLYLFSVYMKRSELLTFPMRDHDVIAKVCL